MLLGQDHELFEAAAEAAKRRVRDDCETKASARVKPLLVHIEQHLFDDPRLDSPTLMRACKVRDKSMPTVFKRELGAAPSAYLRNRRMDTAVRLLVETDLEIWKIGHLVFDVDINSFHGRFSRWSGVSPSKYRKAARESAAGTPSLEQDLRAFGRAIGEGGGAGELTSGQRRRLIRYLRSFDDAPRPLAVDGPSLERGIALTFWERLRHLPPKEQQQLVRQPYGLKTAVLFDVLREKSREEGRKDRQAGVRIAELALASLDGVAAYLAPDELDNRKAQGWAWLGNARRLALDYSAAERDFAAARKTLPKDPDPQVLAEICDLEADLYLFQSKFEKALRLRKQAVELFRSLGNPDLLGESLIASGITKGRAYGPEAAIPDLEEALEFLDPLKQPYPVMAANQNLLTAYSLSGQQAEAQERLAVARSQCSSLGHDLPLHQLQWVEALMSWTDGEFEAAEKSLVEAYQGFQAIAEVAHGAAVALELSELYLELGRTSKAVGWALTSIPVFEAYRYHREALAALKLLSDIAADQAISEAMLRKLRSYLEEIHQVPTLALRTTGLE